MTAETERRIAYCGACGLPAHDTGQRALDGHPLVECIRASESGRQLGHGRVLGSYDYAEVHRWMDATKRHRITPDHHRHVAAGRVNAWCDACAAEPPPRRETLHPYARLRDRIRTVGHLEYSHGDRAIRARLRTITLAEAEAIHRQYHDEAAARSLPKRRNDPVARYSGHD